MKYLLLDEHAIKATNKAKAPSPFRSPVNNVGENDNDLFVNPESIVTIMVESPKEPPNSDFGTSFSSPPLPVSDDPETVTAIEEDVHDASHVSTSNVIADDIQEPIDVNTPRDTTNIFYAYEETDADVSNLQITVEQILPVDSNLTHSSTSQVNNQHSESTVDISHPADATTTVNSDSRSSSSS